MIKRETKNLYIYIINTGSNKFNPRTLLLLSHLFFLFADQKSESVPDRALADFEFGIACAI